jgi:hypothetical protein
MPGRTRRGAAAARLALTVALIGVALLSTARAEASALATPTITVTPTTGLKDGDTVSIVGSGFTPNKAIGVSMCAHPFVDGDSCDLSTAKIGNSDANGGFTMSFPVKGTINTPNDGALACAPNHCQLGASNLNVDGEFGNQVPLIFGAQTTTTQAPAATTTSTSAGATTTRPAGATSSTAAASATTAAGATTTAAGQLAESGASDTLPLLIGGGLVLTVIGALVARRSRMARSS